jgi:uncharacterized membrane protein (UPF0127 family)
MLRMRAMFCPQRTLVPALVVMLGFCAGCRTTAASEQTDARSTTATPVPTPARVALTAPGQDSVTVDVEVVQTPEARQRGLMYRKQLAPDAGMLFIFEQPAQQSFWMHNTLVPLDLIFITSDWHVLGIVENATPMTDTARSVDGSSQYVLEVNAGYSRRHGLGAGTSVKYTPAQ